MNNRTVEIHPGKDRWMAGQVAHLAQGCTTASSNSFDAQQAFIKAFLVLEQQLPQREGCFLTFQLCRRKCAKPSLTRQAARGAVAVLLTPTKISPLLEVFISEGRERARRGERERRDLPRLVL
jgi:hypothetical protein